jgi:lysophospholipase L1-like esterase
MVAVDTKTINKKLELLKARLLLVGICLVPTAPAGKPTKTIVCIGDSITRGWPATQGWPEILQARSGYNVLNKGINGDRTADMVMRFNADVVAYRPGYVIICAGTAALHKMESLNTIGSNIAKMCEIAGQNDIKPIVCKIPPSSIYIVISLASQVNQLNTWVELYAATHGYGVIDFYSVLNDPAHSGRYKPEYSRDGVHPNEAGKQAMAYAIDLGIFQHNNLTWRQAQ